MDLDKCNVDDRGGETRKRVNGIASMDSMRLRVEALEPASEGVCGRGRQNRIHRSWYTTTMDRDMAARVALAIWPRRQR